MPTQRDPDARRQAALDHDPGTAPHDVGGHQQWIVSDTDPATIDPIALGVMLATVSADDARYVAARLAVELREEKTAAREASHAVHAGVRDHDPGFFDGRPDHAELERRRSTFNGHLDEHHHALRADPQRGRARRRRAA